MEAGSRCSLYEDALRPLCSMLSRRVAFSLRPGREHARARPKGLTERSMLSFPAL